MNIYILFFVTPTLGLLRNWSKYKHCNIKTYIRTPFVYFFLYIYYKLFYNSFNIYKILILERWLFFIYKTSRSILNDDYMKKKNKYKIKYKMKYD